MPVTALFMAGSMRVPRDDGRGGLRDHILVVTRWFGGKHLGSDRFRHVKEAVRLCLNALRPGEECRS